MMVYRIEVVRRELDKFGKICKWVISPGYNICQSQREEFRCEVPISIGDVVTCIDLCGQSKITDYRVVTRKFIIDEGKVDFVLLAVEEIIKSDFKYLSYIE